MRWPTVDGAGDGEAIFDADALADRHVGRGEFAGMEFLHVNAKHLISEVPASSRMPFRFTINAYRGCSHACTYCFARPTHDYLGLGIGEDFERRIVVKVNAVELLRAELAPRRWGGHHIAMGTNTDPYQRCEGKYRLTQGIIGVLADAGNPFSILTKSTLVLRDIGRLAAAARQSDVRCNLSIGTLDDRVWKLTEPGTPRPVARVEAVRRLNEAGVPCGVLIAPVLSDAEEQLAAVVDACVAAGAVSISTVYLHLRPGVKDHYLERLADSMPELAAATASRYRGAYLPKADQATLTARVRALVDMARARHGRPASRPSHPAGGPGPVPTGQDRLRQHMGGSRGLTGLPAAPVEAEADQSEQLTFRLG
jgi:DNA repair photolyase